MFARNMLSLTLFAFLLFDVVSADHVGRQNPVTRVVGLMEGLVVKIEKDGKEEEDIWDKYVCWYKTVVSEKQACNAEAKDRLESINSYIDDVESGRVEFSTEKKDLQASIEKLNKEIDEADSLRKQDHDDYDAAKVEMEESIASLEQAVDALGGNSASTSGSSLAAVSATLRRAVALGKRNFGKQDARYLEQALDGAAPTADWKKLNQGNMNKEYTSQSGKITDMVTEMLNTFRDNLADATTQESEGVSTHTALMTSKRSQLSAAQEALAAEEAEGGLKGLNIEEAREQVLSLEAQISDDESYITEAKDAYAVKVTEWKERQRLRTGEIAAIGKAIEVLRSDDARDLMSSSFKSQGAVLLQEADEDSEGCTPKKRKAKAVLSLREASAKHGDTRLAMLALQTQLSTGIDFSNVIAGIDKMISDLNAEAAADWETKENCQNMRMNNTNVAKVNAQAIDDQTALIGRKQAEMNDKQRNVDSIVQQLKTLNLQMEEAQVMRRREKADYESSKADDEAAIALIKQSTKVLSDFYESEGLNFAQMGTNEHADDAVDQAPKIEAGQAPPPPPSTFSQPYGGAKGESKGIISILEMLASDVEKDITTATAMEEKAISDYQSLNSYTLTMISELDSEKADLLVEIGESEEEMVDAKTTRNAKKVVLDSTLGVLRGIAPGCDFMAANFLLRKQNRETEIDGLYESKGALQGGSFALLQKNGQRGAC